VRFIHLDMQSLWIDEYLWVLLGSKDLATIAHMADGYPPGYGFVVHFLLRAGLTSDWWLRVPSAVAGTLAIPLAYYVGRQIEGHVIAILAATLLAIHPLAVWYSQEVGAYALLMLCTLLSTLCVLAILRGGSLRSALGYALCTSLGFSLHYYFLFVVVAHAAVAVRDWGRHPARHYVWLWTGLLTMVALGIWGQSFLIDVASQATEDSTRSFSWLALPYTALTFVGGFSLGPALRTLHPAVSTGVSIWDTLEPSFITALLAIAVSAALMLLSSTRRVGGRRMLVLAMLLCPILGAWLCSAVAVGYRPRYALPALPFALLWCAGSLRAQFRRTACGLLVLFATLALVALVQMDSPLYAREDNRSAAWYIASKGGQAPVVLLGQGTAPFERYDQGRHSVFVLLPYDVQDSTTLQQAMAACFADSQGFWLVSSRPWTADPSNSVPALLQSQCSLREEKLFAGVKVQFYTRCRS